MKPLTKPVIDLELKESITAVGLIEGGKWADVLAVTYGTDDTRFRLRFEQSGNVYSRALEEHESLESVLVRHREALDRWFPYVFREAIYRGDDARNWMRLLIESAEAAQKRCEGNKVMLMPFPNAYGVDQ